MNVLKDGNVHSAAEIKTIIRDRYPDKKITEGIFANALRTMTIDGKCRNPERGKYVINKPMENIEISYQDLKDEIVQKVEELRVSFGEMAKEVDLFQDDTDKVQYVLKVRTAMEKFLKEIKD